MHDSCCSRVVLHGLKLNSLGLCIRVHSSFVMLAEYCCGLAFALTIALKQPLRLLAVSLQAGP